MTLDVHRWSALTNQPKETVDNKYSTEREALATVGTYHKVREKPVANWIMNTQSTTPPKQYKMFTWTGTCLVSTSSAIY